MTGWKTFISCIGCMMLACASAGAQEHNRDSLLTNAGDSIPEGYIAIDTIIYRPAPAVDTSLAGKSIFSELPQKESGSSGDVKVHQSKEIWDAVSAQISENRYRTMSGYRVRIFFDNRRTARSESERTLREFTSRFHDVPAYRSYTNPYFKVTVGDFRTKSEAMQLLRRIRDEFPSAFIVRENISYPVVDRNSPTVTDTVRLLRPAVPQETITL